ncbi:hypothetical protein GLOIN_2v1779027 [Rhizophagus clarus]|uniref:Uncharacterized protein n=1 Tax=Rhizophagus clarus TaxID=94130 RepID=A0A8H3MFR4_9GLOM|nr:hypothetical protein GLOIN_2v1779027 [Rhizophagus clarus]
MQRAKVIDTTYKSTSTKEKVEYFQNLSQVENTVNATNLWENFREKESYEGKIQDIEDIKSLNVQLSSYIAYIERMLVNIPSNVADGKVKYLTDIDKSIIKGADALDELEIKQILSSLYMDGPTPQRLVYRIFFHNACLLRLRGSEHYLLYANNFKKKSDGGYEENDEEFG